MGEQIPNLAWSKGDVGVWAALAERTRPVLGAFLGHHPRCVRETQVDDEKDRARQVERWSDQERAWRRSACGDVRKEALGFGGSLL